MPQKTVVEFIGIPGSGKTTIAKALYERLLSSESVSLPQRSEYRQIDLTFYEKLSIDLRYLHTLLPYRFKRVIYESKHFGFNFLSLRNGWARSRYPGVFFDLAKGMDTNLIILDEWLVHRTIDEDIHFYQAGFDYVGNFFLAPLVHVDNIIFVLVKTNLEVALHRILHDNQPFRHFALDKDKVRISKILNRWAEDIVQIDTALKKLQVPLYIINGNTSVEENVNFLVKSIQSP